MTVARRSALGRHRQLLAALLTLGLLVVTVTAALLTNPDVHLVTGGVESPSFGLTVLLGGAVSAFPLGYAFGAGIVAAVNPCGFVLLPAYLALYLGQTDSAGSRFPIARRLGQALRVSALITAGFVVLFGLAGFGVSLAASAIGASFPWVGLAVGLLLVFAGG